MCMVRHCIMCWKRKKMTSKRRCELMKCANNYRCYPSLPLPPLPMPLPLSPSFFFPQCRLPSVATPGCSADIKLFVRLLNLYYTSELDTGYFLSFFLFSLLQGLLQSLLTITDTPQPMIPPPYKQRARDCPLFLCSLFKVISASSPHMIAQFFCLFVCYINSSWCLFSFCSWFSPFYDLL